MNEKEVKDAIADGALCSVSGRRCGCGDSGRCESRRRRSPLDSDAGEALRWARTAGLRLGEAANALELAVDRLMYDRPYPAPEWRDKLRRIDALIKELEEETKS